jgi:hypothetical protein
MARQRIELAAEEAEELSRRARATTVPVRDRQRAEIILLTSTNAFRPDARSGYPRRLQYQDVNGRPGGAIRANTAALRHDLKAVLVTALPNSLHLDHSPSQDPKQRADRCNCIQLPSRR